MISEHNTNKVNIKLDIDAHLSDKNLFHETVNEIISYIQTSMESHYNLIYDDKNEIFLEQSKCDKNNVKNGHIKYSCHITFSSSKFYWRSRKDIDNFFKAIDLYGKFGEYVDSAIYNDIGIRTAYSHKMIRDKWSIDLDRGAKIPLHPLIKLKVL